jgi:hypothetical protein
MSSDQGVSIGVGIFQAIAAGILAVVAFLAFREARRQAKAAAEAVEAARETARVSALEARRLQLLGTAPYLRISRPELEWPGMTLGVRVENLGPGQALNVGLRLEVQERGSPAYRDTLHGAFPLPVVAHLERPLLTISAEDLRNTGAAFGESTIDDYGQPVHPPIPSNALIPERIRVAVSWLSTLGTKTEQAYLWETRDLSQESDWTWRFESLSIDPGGPYGPPVVVRGMP